MAHRASAAAEQQNIPASERNIRRPGRLKASDSPLALRRLADKGTVGPLLAAAMEQDGADQTQLAIACGRDQGAVSRWHSPTSPDVPTLLDVRWARLAGLHHWAKAAAEIALPGIVPMDDQARAALQQARAAIDALLGKELP
jgi:hypothetical protein